MQRETIMLPNVKNSKVTHKNYGRLLMRSVVRLLIKIILPPAFLLMEYESLMKKKDK